MIGLDVMGAGEGIASQAVVLRVRSIDVAKLKKKAGLGGAESAGLAAGLAAADRFPRLAVDTALPYVRKLLSDYGVDAEVHATDAPPPPRPPSETRAAFLLGFALPFVGYGVYRLFRRRTP